MSARGSPEQVSEVARFSVGKPVYIHGCGPREQKGGPVADADLYLRKLQKPEPRKPAVVTDCAAELPDTGPLDTGS